MFQTVLKQFLQIILPILCRDPADPATGLSLLRRALCLTRSACIQPGTSLWRMSLRAARV